MFDFIIHKIFTKIKIFNEKIFIIFRFCAIMITNRAFLVKIALTVKKEYSMDYVEQTVRKNYIYEGKILKLRRDDARLPDGRPCVREIIEHSG